MILGDDLSETLLKISQREQMLTLMVFLVPKLIPRFSELFQLMSHASLKMHVIEPEWLEILV